MRTSVRSALAIFVAIVVVGCLPAADGSGRIVGQVVDDEGRPVEGALVTRQPLFETTISDEGFTTDAEGRFATDPLVPGRYDVTALVGGTVVGSVEVTVGEGDTSVTIQADSQ